MGERTTMTKKTMQFQGQARADADADADLVSHSYMHGHIIRMRREYEAQTRRDVRAVVVGALAGLVTVALLVALAWWVKG